MKLFKKSLRTAGTLAILVTLMFVFTAVTYAAIDPDTVYKTALDEVEAAASAGDFVLLNTKAYDAAMYAVDNELTIQEACHQIAFVTITAASASGQSIPSATQAAVDGVSIAAEELAERVQAATEETEMPSIELDARACAIHGLRAAAEAMGLEDPEAFVAINIPFAPPAEPTLLDATSNNPTPTALSVE
jgi:hypothetical protein